MKKINNKKQTSLSFGHLPLKKGEVLKQSGFTLVELLISVSIIAILGVILVVNFSSAQKSGRDQRRISDLKAVQNAAEQFYLLNGSRYPTTVSVGWTGPGAQVILDKFPTDPRSNVGTTVPYIINTINNSTYCICAKVENDKYGNSNGSNCTFGDAAVDNCKILKSCHFCIKNQQ